MNSAILFLIVIVLLSLGYIIYSKVLSKLFGLNDFIPTPANSCRDSCDFIPAKHWTILFGHHFSSIAGAGPIIGPVLGVVMWGWFPTIAWIVLGTVLIGGVHDFGSLIVSLRNRGSSLPDVSEKLISKRAKFLFGMFVWLALILVDAIFIIFAAKTFVNEPGVVLPAFGLLPVAIAVGYFLYIKNSKQCIVTVLGLLCLLILILLGPMVTINLNVTVWSIILIVYCYFASVTPVNILLQPRDYLSGYLLLFGILFGVIGIFVLHTNIQLPAFCGFAGSNNIPLWPMLFVTVACGAVSGFHSMVASGTTSKQINRESDAPRIGYGAMVMEGVLAAIALIAVAGFLTLPEAKGFLKAENPIGAFGQGYGKLTLPFLGGYGKIFALTILNAFVLTTLDSATRITRYLTSELFGIKNKHIATLIVLVLAGWLAFSGEGGKIWPVFGASNQLVAALALIVISTWLLQSGKNINYTLWPTAFMLITTIGALVYQSVKFFNNNNFILAIISIVLIILAIFLVFETIQILLKKKRPTAPQAAQL